MNLQWGWCRHWRGIGLGGDLRPRIGMPQLRRCGFNFRWLARFQDSRLGVFGGFHVVDGRIHQFSDGRDSGDVCLGKARAIGRELEKAYNLVLPKYGDRDLHKLTLKGMGRNRNRLGGRDTGCDWCMLRVGRSAGFVGYSGRGAV